MSSNSGNAMFALLAGAAIGAVVGILYAPDKGTRTREKLREGFDDAKNNLKDKLENASDELKNRFSGASFDLEETYENLVSNMSHKAEDVISFLETKLADLKQQNARYQKDNQQNQYSE
ncbi:MAG TPA: YtxH domain-containing protein [Flavobacterium sp.]|nr:YtxH domain-containing protein [Flavobacterium sp.]